MRQTVDGSQAPDQINGVNADGFPVGEECLNDVERNPVIGIVKRGNQNGGIANIKIGVACREAQIDKNFLFVSWSIFSRLLYVKNIWATRYRRWII